MSQRVGAGARGRRAGPDVGLPVRPLLHRGVVPERIAGDERGRRAVRIDEGRTLLRIRLRQESFGGHLHERRVRIERVAVRVRELHRFDDRVEIVGARVAHRAEIELLQDVERLQQHGTLAAEPVLVDGVASIGRAGRLLDPREILREIALVERRVVLSKKRHHLARDVALVEPVARRDDAGGASAGPARRVRPRPCVAACGRSPAA